MGRVRFSSFGPRARHAARRESRSPWTCAATSRASTKTRRQSAAELRVGAAELPGACDVPKTGLPSQRTPHLVSCRIPREPTNAFLATYALKMLGKHPAGRFVQLVGERGSDGTMRDSGDRRGRQVECEHCLVAVEVLSRGEFVVHALEPIQTVLDGNPMAYLSGERQSMTPAGGERLAVHALSRASVPTRSRASTAPVRHAIIRVLLG